MPMPIAPHAVRSSKSYEDEQAYDLWDCLPLEDRFKNETSLVQRAVIDIDEDTYVVVNSETPSFKDRVKMVFKPTKPHFRYTKVTHYLEPEDVELPLSDEERLAARRWLLANEPVVTSGKPTPTPKEQGEQAMSLLDFERVGSAALIEAIKKLPKPDELLIKLPHKITYEDKKRINRIVRAVIAGKPVNAKVTL